jgi:hypothetical protein
MVTTPKNKQYEKIDIYRGTACPHGMPQEGDRHFHEQHGSTN